MTFVLFQEHSVISQSSKRRLYIYMYMYMYMYITCFDNHTGEKTEAICYRIWVVLH